MTLRSFLGAVALLVGLITFGVYADWRRNPNADRPTPPGFAWGVFVVIVILAALILPGS